MPQQEHWVLDNDGHFAWKNGKADWSNGDWHHQPFIDDGSGAGQIAAIHCNCDIAAVPCQCAISYSPLTGQPDAVYPLCDATPIPPAQLETEVMVSIDHQVPFGDPEIATAEAGAGLQALDIDPGAVGKGVHNIDSNDNQLDWILAAFTGEVTTLGAEKMSRMLGQS